MPFKGVDVMYIKKEFILKAMDVNVNFTELCREYSPKIFGKHVINSQPSCTSPFSLLTSNLNTVL